MNFSMSAMMAPRKTVEHAGGVGVVPYPAVVGWLQFNREPKGVAESTSVPSISGFIQVERSRPSLTNAKHRSIYNSTGCSPSRSGTNGR